MDIKNNAIVTFAVMFSCLACGTTAAYLHSIIPMLALAIGLALIFIHRDRDDREL